MQGAHVPILCAIGDQTCSLHLLQRCLSQCFGYARGLFVVL